MTNNYARGRGREGSLKNKLWEKGFVAIRSYHSAGGAPLAFQQYPDLIRRKLQKMVMPIDLTASHPVFGTCYIQVSKYLEDIDMKEINELKRLAERVLVHPILAYEKISRRKEHKKQKGWKFLDISVEEPVITNAVEVFLLQ